MQRPAWEATTTIMALQCKSSCKQCVAKPTDYKIFNDPIHGSITLHPLCVKIMDTVDFQRLRQIKQLGCCYYVFPGASHNRFEHSIGVSHLAGEFARALHGRQPELNINYQDVLCLEIAGLCHDLGHGPCSHVFDGLVMPLVDPDTKWTHEDASKMIFEHLMSKDEMKKEFSKHHMGDDDIAFIKELISPPEDENCKSRSDKHFLYEIVANKETGIDVDKWDYFSRDAHMLGVAKSFDHNRFMKFSRVIQCDDRKYHICMRDKEAKNVYEMFHTRDMLHRRAYQHRVTKAVEIMIADAFNLANGKLTLPGTGRKMNLPEDIRDVNVYTKMTDNILYDMLNSTEDELKASRDLIKKVLERNLYAFIGEASPKDNEKIENKRENIQKITCEIVKKQDQKSANILSEDDLNLQVITFHHGKKDKDPVKFVRFYSKHDLTKTTTISSDDVSIMLPMNFMEQKFRLYCKSYDEGKIRKAKTCFKEWCTAMGHKLKPGHERPAPEPIQEAAQQYM